MDQYQNPDDLHNKVASLKPGDQIHGEASVEAIASSLVAKLHIMEGTITDVKDDNHIPTMLFQAESPDGTRSTMLLGVPHIRDILDVCGRWFADNEHLDIPRDDDDHDHDCGCGRPHSPDDIFGCAEYTFITDLGDNVDDRLETVPKDRVQAMAAVEVNSGGVKVIPIPDTLENMEDHNEFEVYAMQVETMTGRRMEFMMQPETAHELSLHIAKWSVSKMMEHQEREHGGGLPPGLKNLIDDILRHDDDNDG